MPLVELHILQGYGPDEKRRLHECLTAAVRFVLPAPADAITVMIHEMTADNYSRGRIRREGAPASPDPCVIVKSYLQAMEAREIERARRMLGEGFTMHFPGVPPMHRVEELLDWAKTRYRFVKKAYEGFDGMQSPGQEAVVYCRGTLSGEWLDGSPFDNIRFIDRFEIVAGKIARQDVWNDIAEIKAQL